MAFWDDLWNQAKESVEDGLDKIKAVGVPAIQATAEQWLLDTVNAQHKETTAQLNNAIKEVQASGDGGPLSEAFETVTKDSVFSLYGHYIIFGVAGIALAGYLLARK